MEKEKNSTSTTEYRDYSTVGIGDVFLESPPHPLASFYLDTSKTLDFSELKTWEMVGTIKSVPEDFVVREVALPGRKIGNLSEEEVKAIDVADLIDNQISDPIKTKQPKVCETPASEDISSKAKGLKGNVSCLKEMLSTNNDIVDEDQVVNSIEGSIALLTTIFEKCSDNNQTSPIDVLNELKDLQKHARSCLKNETVDVTDEKLKPVRIVFPNHLDESSGLDRSAFHRAIRIAFPLLRSETVPNTTNTYQVNIGIDDFFRDLIPYLYQPQVDLPLLYDFFKRGFEYAKQQSRNSKNANQETCSKSQTTSSQKDDRKRFKKQQRSNARSYINENTIDPILRLKPDLPRSERRPVHQIIDAKTKGLLGTNTISEYPLHKEQDNQLSSNKSESISAEPKPTTSAIVVSWTKAAERKLAKKRKRESVDGTSNSVTKQCNTLCVVRKRRREHLDALQTLAKAFRCRQPDVAFAGIKDMHAVTYQFCTIQNTHPSRIKAAKKFLRSKDMDIGTIHSVGWLLRKGDLLGNRFDIVIRNLQRVSVQRDATGAISENFQTVDSEHFDQMVERVRNTGFVNFYGEQRVGEPGKGSVAGVRAFDIGRAMLQQDFTKAIDLLMSGRKIINGSAEQQSDEIRAFRQAWKESEGDPDLTMKMLPRSQTAVPRERLILKGLKRYGRDNPLAALRCLQHNERIFFINAYQSYVWNMMVTKRLRKYGNQVVKGDLVIREGKKEVECVSDDVFGVEFSDVVLPLPGYDVSYPDNEIGNAYKEILRNDNIVYNKNAPEEGTAKGNYRHITAKASSVEYSHMVDENQSKLSDCVKISFQLPKGSYATMFLRELMLTTVVRDG